MKQKEFKIRIAKISEMAFSSYEQKDAIIKSIDENSIGFKIGYRVIPKKKESEIDIILAIDYIFDKGKEPVVLCSYAIVVSYKIDIFKNAVEEIAGGKEVSIEDELVARLLGVAIGAARGMISLKTAGTYLNSIHLPIVDALSIVQKKNEKAKKQ